jgi:hypothetical protein
LPAGIEYRQDREEGDQFFYTVLHTLEFSLNV